MNTSIHTWKLCWLVFEVHYFKGNGIKLSWLLRQKDS
jgi:hypothetical protein